jgi:hypothetical protein
MGIDAWGWDRPLHLQAQDAVAAGQPRIFWAAHQADLAYSQIERLANPGGIAANRLHGRMLPAAAGGRERGAGAGGGNRRVGGGRPAPGAAPRAKSPRAFRAESPGKLGSVMHLVP